jgi:hypothetical protein
VGDHRRRSFESLDDVEKIGRQTIWHYREEMDETKREMLKIFSRTCGRCINFVVLAPLQEACPLRPAERRNRTFGFSMSLSTEGNEKKNGKAN